MIFSSKKNKTEVQALAENLFGYIYQFFVPDTS